MLDVLVDSPLPFHPELARQETTLPRPSGSADQMHSCQIWRESPPGAAASLQSHSQAGGQADTSAGSGWAPGPTIISPSQEWAEL